VGSYDLSKPLVALEHESTLVCVIEMSGSSWLVAATVPGVDRRPLQTGQSYMEFAVVDDWHRLLDE
jgi:transposase